MFNQNNTFSSFLIGHSGTDNCFAYAAALGAAENPGKGYNPLMLCGGVGIGKTHLLHAVGHHVSSHKKGAHVAFLSAEQLTSEYAKAVQRAELAQFRQKYLQTDLLLIDDIQHLVGKDSLQEELFHTCRFLHGAQKQIVMAGNCSPSEMEELEQRFISRFEWGLVAELHRSDDQMCMPRDGQKTQVVPVS